MASVAPGGSAGAHNRGTESQSNLRFTAGIYIAPDTLFSVHEERYACAHICSSCAISDGSPKLS